MLFLSERHVYKFLRAAAQNRFAVDEDLAIQQIQVNGWARPPLGSSDSPWHLDLTLGDSPFDSAALQRRRPMVIFDRPVWIASPEDLIVYKLVSARERDLEDVREVFRAQTILDRDYLTKWVDWWEAEGIAGIRRRYDDLSA